MSSPRKLWLLAVVLGVCASAIVPETKFAGTRLLTLVAVSVMIGTLGWLVISRLASRSRTRDMPALDCRPADGRVDLAMVERVQSRPNSVDPRFGRFLERMPDGRSEITTEGRKSSGRCPDLRGRIVVVSVFVGRDGHSWSDRAIARSLGGVVRAGEWIEREAIRWRVPVNLEIAATYFQTSDDTEDEVDLELHYEAGSLEATDKREIAKALASLNRAALALGFDHARQLIDSIEQRLRADVVVWLLHPHRAGRSFAIPADLTAGGNVNLAVCYPTFADLPEPLSGESSVSPVTIAHELLHLFGASDKYNQPLRSFVSGSVTRRDIMRLAEVRLWRFRVDPATAFEIAWGSPR